MSGRMHLLREAEAEAEVEEEVDVEMVARID